MMAKRILVLRSLVLLFLLLSLKRSFSSNISVCHSLRGEKADETKPLYICESIFQLQTSKATYWRSKLALQLLLLLAGDIEICPGPERNIREPLSLLSHR